MDFVSHSAGVPLTPLIKGHDRERFDVLVFDMSSDGRFKDELGAIPIGHLDINTARQRIYEARPDIMIDTTANLRDGCEWLGAGFADLLSMPGGMTRPIGVSNRTSFSATRS